MSRFTRIVQRGTKFQLNIPKRFLDLSGWKLKTKPKYTYVNMDYDYERDALIITSRYTMPPHNKEEGEILKQALQTKKYLAVMEKSEKEWKKRSNPRLPLIEKLPEEVSKNKWIKKHYTEIVKLKNKLEIEEKKYKEKTEKDIERYRDLKIILSEEIRKILLKD